MTEQSLEAKLRTLEHKHKLINDAWQKTGNRELLAFFVELMPKALDCERCSIFILDPVDNNIWVQCGTGLLEKQVSVSQSGSMVGEVISTGEPRLVEDMQGQVGTHDIVAAQTGFVARNALCVPIHGVSTKRVTGAIQVLNKQQGKRFTQHDHALLDKLAYHLQMNIENIFLRQEMSKLSVALGKKIQELKARLGGHA
jgi:transcriptional regulator with GAF, ATPase, and Fis domain